MRIAFRQITILAALALFWAAPANLYSQAKELKDLNTSYPLGGSSSYF